MPSKRFQGPCTNCDELDSSGYYRKKMCNNCYRKERRKERGLKPTRIPEYAGPCVICGTFESSNGKFVKQKCRACYKRISNTGNILPVSKYEGPCIDCGTCESSRYFRQMCPACYKRKIYAQKVKSKKVFCIDCGTEISRLSKTKRCASCHHKYRWNNDSKYKEGRLKSVEAYNQSEKGKENNKRRNISRRLKMLGVKNELTHEQWEKVLSHYDSRCAYCSTKIEGYNLTVDHVIPLSKGGTHTIDNVVPACRSCNSTKSAGDPPKSVFVLPE